MSKQPYEVIVTAIQTVGKKEVIVAQYSELFKNEDGEQAFKNAVSSFMKTERLPKESE